MKTSTILLCLVFWSVAGWSQVCTPDSSIISSNGIFPDSATGIPEAYEGVFYEQIVTIITPADTQAVLFPNLPAQQVLIDSIVLDSVFTVPSWLTYECEPADCAFIGGELGCIRFYGTPPAGEAGKSYSINFVTRSHGRLALFPTTPLPAQVDTTFNYYTLTIGTSTDIERPDHSTISLYPNPAADGFFLEIDGSTAYHVLVYNSIGQVQWQSTLTQRSWIPTTSWPAGMYWVQLSDGQTQMVKQVVIN